jgi:uncharacterized CHY-type Zn-finger protein
LYVHIKKNGTSISAREAPKLLGVDANTFRKSVQKAINESRISKLDSVIGIGNEFEYVPNSNICVVCGKQVFRRKWMVGDIAYCSKACQNELPPSIALLTNRLGIDERTLLYALVQCFSGLKICELLQLEEKDFKKWVFKLCGIRIKELTDNVPMTCEPVIDKTIKINNKCQSKYFILNNDSVFKKVDDFCSI